MKILSNYPREARRSFDNKRIPLIVIDRKKYRRKIYINHRVHLTNLLFVLAYLADTYDFLLVYLV